jgi:hypothetical protein
LSLGTTKRVTPDNDAVTSPRLLSVVIVCYDMARELPRVIRSLAPDQQRDIALTDYELIVVDNGSATPPVLDDLERLAPNVGLVRLPSTSPSPAHALNVGVARARGTHLGLMIDGSHIASPGTLGLAARALGAYERGVAVVPAFTLGWDSMQALALASGYSIEQEDALLAQSDWVADGYRLFDLVAPVGVNADPWIGPFVESNLFFLSRTMWDEMGGVDERFDIPRGGFVNPDTLKRALELPGARCIELLGEATFHQLHGNLDRRTVTSQQSVVPEWVAQYESLRGAKFVSPNPSDRIYFGALSAPARRHFQRAVTQPISSATWPTRPVARAAATPRDAPSARTSAALLSLAKRELEAGRFVAAAEVCRVGRARLDDFSEFVPILVASSPSMRLVDLPDTQRYELHVARGEALMITGEIKAANSEFEAAIEIGAIDSRAHLGLARATLLGDSYMVHLGKLHELLNPGVYLEIGVANGLSIALARPPTVAIGIDPTPRLTTPVSATTSIFPLTSDDFFATSAHDALRGNSIDLAFIDGLHHFEQALRDFANVEAHSTRATVCLFHDTLPLDEMTQRRDRQTDFWTGDIWKLAVVLAERRPDLALFTVPTFPAGLTVVTNLDPGRRPEDYMSASVLDEFMALGFDEAEQRRNDALNLVPNEWSVLEQRLTNSGPTAPSGPPSSASSDRRDRRIGRLVRALTR